jgi:S-adenosylmethionine:tRNA ribosyltransferase-isomerase
VRTDLFDYELPEAHIARWPSPERGDARLLVVAEHGVEHRRVAEFPDLVPEASLVVLNDTRVIPARLVGARAGTGGKVEVLLLRRLDTEPGDASVQEFLALGHANRPLLPGARIEAGPLAVEVIGRAEEAVLTVRLCAEGGVRAALEQHGHVPIPPYLGRADAPCDRDRYQTVYAAQDGSVAAPTAGLHLTEPMLERLRARGVEIGRVTLHVGLATFRPVSVDDLDDHPMHEERVEIGEQLVEQIARARQRGAPVVAVGTTVVRALESADLTPGAFDTRLLIQPGFRFQVVDALLTNFHQPRSTLLALVAAFVGRDRILAAYRTAIAEQYRFLSYGDATYLPRRIAAG